MPIVSVDLDTDLHEWLAERAAEHERSVGAELAALTVEAHKRESDKTATTPLPVGVYEADDGRTVVELGDRTVEESELPVGVYHDATAEE